MDDEICTRNLVGKAEANRPFVRPGERLEDTVKMELK
jgi:hypothetical protein